MTNDARQVDSRNNTRQGNNRKNICTVCWECHHCSRKSCRKKNLQNLKKILLLVKDEIYLPIGQMQLTVEETHTLLWTRYNWQSQKYSWHFKKYLPCCGQKVVDNQRNKVSNGGSQQSGNVLLRLWLQWHDNWDGTQRHNNSGSRQIMGDSASWTIKSVVWRHWSVLVV